MIELFRLFEFLYIKRSFHCKKQEKNWLANDHVEYWAYVEQEWIPFLFVQRGAIKISLCVLTFVQLASGVPDFNCVLSSVKSPNNQKKAEEMEKSQI